MQFRLGVRLRRDPAFSGSGRESFAHPGESTISTENMGFRHLLPSFTGQSPTKLLGSGGVDYCLLWEGDPRLGCLGKPLGSESCLRSPFTSGSLGRVDPQVASGDRERRSSKALRREAPDPREAQAGGRLLGRWSRGGGPGVGRAVRWRTGVSRPAWAVGRSPAGPLQQFSGLLLLLCCWCCCCCCRRCCCPLSR